MCAWIGPRTSGGAVTPAHVALDDLGTDSCYYIVTVDKCCLAVEGYSRMVSPSDCSVTSWLSMAATVMNLWMC